MSNEVTAEAEPAVVESETFEQHSSSDIHLQTLVGELENRLDERRTIREEEPTSEVDASLRPDVDQSEGMVEVFDDDADDDRIQRLHELDTEIAQLLLDNQEIVIDELARSVGDNS